MLKQMKFQNSIDHCYNGNECLTRIYELDKKPCKCEYKVILMDINMPILGGIETTKLIF